jgi:hypothetical protein
VDDLFAGESQPRPRETLLPLQFLVLEIGLHHIDRLQPEGRGVHTRALRA